MRSVEACELPEKSLLSGYRDDGAYTDCYATEINVAVSLRQFVAAFYTTRLFKFERLILKWAVSKSSTDDEAHVLAEGKSEAFAAWDVETRQNDQIVLSDYQGRTRSWLMCATFSGGDGIGTRLFFGSAFVPVRKTGPGVRRMGAPFFALVPFHRLYSRALLLSAKRRLSRQMAEK